MSIRDITVGHIPVPGAAALPLTLDVKSLIANRLLIQANSGGGKSNSIRLLVEKVAESIPCVIIDPEGEFFTLREKVDMVLVGEGGEMEASVKNAGELAIKILELGVSAVIDISALNGDDRREFVRRYCENLLAVHRRLWRPFMFVIDEAQLFCPQDSESVARVPIADLMTRARKRQICAVLATGRLGLLDADARAPINNFMIGRATLDIDYTRAGKILGMPRGEYRTLSMLEMGQFHAFGPSFGHRGVSLAQLDKAETKPPKPGSTAAGLPSPSAAIMAVIPELTKLAEADVQNPDKVRTIEEARARIRVLKGERDKAGHDLAAANRSLERARAQPAAPVKPDKDLVAANRELERLLEELMKFVINVSTKEFGEQDGEELKKAVTAAVEAGMKRVEVLMQGRKAEINKLKAEAARLADRVQGLRASRVAQVDVAVVKQPPFALAAAPERSPARPAPASNGEAAPGNGELVKGPRRILIAVAQYAETGGITREQMTTLTGYKKSSRDTYIKDLRSQGYIAEDGGRFAPTPEGVAVLGADYEPLPTGPDLQRHWLTKLSGGHKVILEALVAAHPSPMGREELSAATNYKKSSRDTYLKDLRNMQVIDVLPGGQVKASDQLF